MEETTTENPAEFDLIDPETGFSVYVATELRGNRMFSTMLDNVTNLNWLAWIGL